MKKSEKLIYLYFFLLPFIDLFTSLTVNLTAFSITPGMIFKGLTLIFCLVYIFVFSKSKYKKKSIIYLSLLIVFGLVYILSKNYILSLSIIASEAKNAYKYFYFPIMICGMLNIFDDFRFSKNLIIKILIVNAIVYTILMIVPFITSTSFNSYYNYQTFKGQKGWFYAANEVGAILTILLITIYYILNYRNKWYISIILPLMISIAIIGTKVSFLGLIIMTILCLVVTLFNKKKNAIIPCIVVCIFFCMSLFFSPTFNNFSILKSNSENTSSKVNQSEKTNENIDSAKDNNESKIKENNISAEVVNEIKKLEGSLPLQLVVNNLRVILSGRDIYLINNLNVYINSNLEDKLFGLGWEDRQEINYTFDKKLVEIDVADIFIHYGLIGFIIYFLPLLYCFILGIKNIRYFDEESWLNLLTFMTGIGISLMAGHILSAPTVSIYLVLLICLTMITVRDNKEVK